jgi:hypothetical protein
MDPNLETLTKIKSSTARYTLENLNMLANEYKATLGSLPEKLIGSTQISFTCSCGTNLSKGFRSCIDYGMLCPKCIKKYLDINKGDDTRVKTLKYTIDEVYNKANIFKSTLDSESVKILNDRKNIRPTIAKEQILGFKCGMCSIDDSKSVKSIFESGMICKNCSVKNGKAKQNATNLDKYGHVEFFGSNIGKEKVRQSLLENGYDHPGKNPESIKKCMETCKKIYGYECVFQVPEIKEKIRNKLLETDGVDNNAKRTCSKKKTIETNMAKYGVPYACMAPEVIAKRNETSNQIYGASTYFGSDQYKNYLRTYNLNKYQTEHAMQNKEFLNFVRNAYYLKTGYKNPFSNPDIQPKILINKEKSSMDKCGVRSYSQTPEFMSKLKKSSYKKKEYTLPSGKKIDLMGYEHFAVRDLLNMGFLEGDIITEDVPIIDYISDDGKCRCYHPDIYIISKNLLIEVKSPFTFTKNYSVNMRKSKASLDSGYNFEFWIYDKYGNRVPENNLETNLPKYRIESENDDIKDREITLECVGDSIVANISDDIQIALNINVLQMNN